MNREKSSESRKKRRNSLSTSSSISIDYLNVHEPLFENVENTQNEDQAHVYPKRSRRTSHSQRHTKRHNTAWRLFKKIFKPVLAATYSQIFAFVLFILISMVFNSLYFNFYYIQTINDHTTDHKYSKNVPNSNFFTKNLQHVVFPSMNEKDEIEEQYSLVNKDLNEEKLLATLEQVEQEYRNKERLKKQQEQQHEAQMALSLALNMQSEGKLDKADKIYTHALSLDPQNADALTSYGEYLEVHKNDIITAEHLYTKVITLEPQHSKASLNLKRASPIVNKLDRLMLDKLDGLLRKFYEIPVTSDALKRAKREAYFMHIYHSNAIEGNTLNLHQTRHILQNRMAISGKSLIEHQEVLGLDAAMRYLNKTLLNRNMYVLSVQDILEIHRRVLGYSDPIESGKFRNHQVYVGNFVPPAPVQVKSLMYEFVEWLNSNQLLTEAHPVQIAALAHYKFVYIHPFYDGNGRTARLLMNLILMKSGYPPVIIKKEDRLDYYEYLEMANKGDVKPFIRFIARCAKRTLEEYIMLCDNSGISGGKNELNKRITDGVIINQFDEEVIARSKSVDNEVFRPELGWSEGAALRTKRARKQTISSRGFCEVKNYSNEIFFKC